MGPKAQAAGGKRKAVEDAEQPLAKRRSTRPRSTTKAQAARTTTKTTTAKPTARRAAAQAKTTATKKAAPKKTAPEKAAPKPAAPKKEPKPRPALPVINQAPTQKLDVFVCGQGESAELGLGTAANGVIVKRPRLNRFLAADTVGVVHVVCGAMHAAALTYDNKILTWGVNDAGACGRDTVWSGKMKSADAASGNGSDDEADDDDDNGLNPKEAIPTAISSEYFPPGTKFVQLAAGDSCTFALTADGSVYGWGTFSKNEGVLGFSPTVYKQFRPVLVPELKKIKRIICGSNHVFALDANGTVFAFGAGQQNQLGRRLVERTGKQSLIPREMPLPKKKISSIATGSDHGFAIRNDGVVYAWGLNNFCQCGIEQADLDDTIVKTPTIVGSLTKRKWEMLDGGAHHSVGVAKNGDAFTWGRADGGQVGLDLSTLPEEDLVKNERDQIKAVLMPTRISEQRFKYASTMLDHTIALTEGGQAYSWGFSTLFETGLGVDKDVLIPTLVDNTAVRGKNLNWVGAGAHFSIFTAPAEEQAGRT